MSTTIERSLQRLTEGVEGRFWGKYRGLVVDDADPECRGRLVLKVPCLLGPDVVTGWALPCGPYGGPDQGVFFVPEPGAGVWVEFEGGLLEYPLWSGCWWAAPGGASEVPKPADGQSPPTSKVIKTKSHCLEFADGSQPAIRLSDLANGSTVVIDQAGVAIEDGNGNHVALTATGIEVKDANGNQVTLSAGGVTIDAPKINLGKSAAEPLIKGQTLVTLLTAFAAHTHVCTAPGSPSGPAVPAPAWTSALSTTGFTQ